ncbi:MAG: alkaline phosphatase family protein [Rhodovibrionaceae bacterium]
MAEKPKKVLLIVGDQWRWECLGAMGHPLVKTPHLDALAAEGVLFRNHYTQASPCGPARTSLLTGLYAMTHRSIANGTPLDARFGNLALEARKLGSRPLLFGYSDTTMDPRAHAPGDPELRGYEGILPGMEPICRLTEDYRLWQAALARQGYRLPETAEGLFTPLDDPAQRGHLHSLAPAFYKAEHSLTAFLADALLDYIGVNRDLSWLAYVSFMHPHPPLTAPAPYHEMYDPADTMAPQRAESPQAEAAQHPFLDYYLNRPRELFYFAGQGAKTADISEEVVRRMRATYLGLISEVDAHIGRIVQQLKDQGDYDDTLIVFTVDHADMLGDHWMFGKDGYFDQAFHIPLIVRDPRKKADAGRGSTVESFTEAVDLMPTILEWLGGTPPRQCDGASLRPFLEGRTPETWRRAAHWEYDFRDVAGGKAEAALGIDSDRCSLAVLREERFKYVHFAGLPPLLFDLQADPGEFQDLSQAPEHQATLLRCAQEMLSWRMAHAERTLTNILVTPAGPLGF